MNIKNAQFSDSYKYKRKICDEYECKEVQESVIPSIGHALMVIEDEIKYDEKSSYFKNSNKDFYGDFVSLRIKPQSYSADTSRPAFISPMKNITPKDVTDKRIYEVNLEALNAEKIDLIVKIRNNYFTLHLKG